MLFFRPPICKLTNEYAAFINLIIAAVTGGLLLCSSGSRAWADAIPYATPGVVNPEVYTFTASSTGDIIAYFADSTAGDTNLLGLQVNGVSTGVFGLNNQTSHTGRQS